MSQKIGELNRRAAQLPAECLHHLVRRQESFDAAPDVIVVSIPELSESGSGEAAQQTVTTAENTLTTTIDTQHVFGHLDRALIDSMMPVGEVIDRQRHACVMLHDLDPGARGGRIAGALSVALSQRKGKTLWVGCRRLAAETRQAAEFLGKSLLPNQAHHAQGNEILATTTSDLHMLVVSPVVSHRDGKVHCDWGLVVERLLIHRERFAHMVVSCECQSLAEVHQWKRVASGGVMVIHRFNSDRSKASSIARLWKTAGLPTLGCIVVE